MNIILSNVSKKISNYKGLQRTELIVLIIILIGGAIYIFETWDKFSSRRNEEALQIARTAQASLPLYLLHDLKASPEDSISPSYKLLKDALIRVARVNPKVSFAYLFALKNGRIFFYADSELENSSNYSPPGEEFYEAKDEDRLPFITGKELITKPMSDRWGKWVTIYIPVIDENTGTVNAVFGMDFDSDAWNKSLFQDVSRSVLLILLILLTWFFQYRVLIKNRTLKSLLKTTAKAEKALQYSETRMRSITNSANDAILMMDQTGAITYWNPAAERIFGYTGSEVLGKDLHNLLAPDKYHDAFKNAFPLFVETGEGSAVGKTLDLEAIRKDGSVIPVQLSLSSLKIDGNWNAIGILRDTTERKIIEESLIKAKQDSEAANKAKSVFLSNMSHEIRTPLNSIIGFSQLMSREKDLNDRQKEYINSIIKAGEHLLELINEILELSKIEAGRIVLNPSTIDLHSLCEDIRMMFSEKAKEKNLQLIFECTDELPQYVVIDEGKLRQVLVNIIGNAVKFTEEGGIAIRVRTNRDKNGKYYLIVEVQDSGPGISEDELGKLFKHFEQTSAGVKQGSGTGLGLALSKELAQLMGGDISVSSKTGEGSIFTIKVEYKEGNIDDIEKLENKKIISIANHDKKYKILVVDDKVENLKVTVNLLNVVGFETIEAVDGKDAIEKLSNNRPDLILMDMRMPVMDGYEAIRMIKSMKEFKDIPIVALTASTFEDERKRIEALNIEGYIRKPFRENDLFNIIGNLLKVQYIYEKENESERKIVSETRNIQLSHKQVSEISDAISVADMDKLLVIIDQIELIYPQFAYKLKVLAQNYDYSQIEELLKTIKVDE